MNSIETYQWVKDLSHGKVNLSEKVIRAIKFSGVGALAGGLIAWKTNNPIFTFAIIGGIVAGVASNYVE